MHKRTIHTSNEFAYDVLNNMIHHSEIVIPKRDKKETKAIRGIIGKFGYCLQLEERKDSYLIRRTMPLNLCVVFRKNN